MKVNDQKLYQFIKNASAATYAGGGKYEKTPERPGFLELTFQEGDWHYRDSYTGFYSSRGTETVRFKNNIVWISQYGGGMKKDFENQAKETFNFLKQAMLQKNDALKFSFRGPSEFVKGEWLYTYQQDGGVEEFIGFETIRYKNQLAFSHRIIGGRVKNK